jgi:hypothetical protein
MSLEQCQRPIIPAIGVSVCRRVGVWRLAAERGDGAKSALREIFPSLSRLHSLIRLVVLIAIASWGQIALSLGTHY